ncbi:STAM-binding protein-like A [Echinococcus granulosus]|uniref:STAM binding protein n=1 Tax=Echinococcus granulosus TaxID=6210 RepID=U6JM54_ECHGR|nr:STAM-binding protein-like protein [Echinococcus granulosus]EUB60678.1 STAM-binding protein-like protein [Echinococcus granulosus]KAH9283855.1 STAM-binding protein-like A [Echinococcus granulosus]CDS23541.1 STAM binding protein [Echinococcus granulosus]
MASPYPGENDGKIMTAYERMKELNRQIYVDYADNVSLSSYFRFCRSMLNMAKEHEEDGSKIKAYCLRKRFVILFIDHLSLREDFKHSGSDIRNSWCCECNRVLKIVEKMHKEILEEFKAEELLRQKISAAPFGATADATTVLPGANSGRRSLSFSQSPSSVTPSLSSTATPVPNSSCSPPQSPTLLLSGITPPKIDRSLKPSTVKPLSRNGLNPILVPRTLASTFLKLAESNTRANRETCGTLCGHLSPKGDKLVISHIIVCKQTGTADSCTTTNEEELIGCLESDGLIVMGWIHTHPSQTAFMSSLDLHCHLSYQLMLPEAIAIVCAPKHDQVGYFSLTPDYGLDFVRDCKETGFHTHTSLRELYAACEHIVHTEGKVEVVDLR